MTVAAANPQKLDIEFKSFQEALNYRTECPFCHSKLVYDRGEIKKEVDIHGRPIWTIIEGKIKSFKETVIIYSNGEINVLNWMSGGKLEIPINFKCQVSNSEHKYSFEFAVVADVDNHKIDLIYCLGEWIKIKINNISHSLSNSVDFYSTLYTTSADLQQPQYIQLPYFPINIENPLETIEKAKLLITFS